MAGWSLLESRLPLEREGTAKGRFNPETMNGLTPT